MQWGSIVAIKRYKYKHFLFGVVFFLLTEAFEPKKKQKNIENKNMLEPSPQLTNLNFTEIKWRGKKHNTDSMTWSILVTCCFDGKTYNGLNNITGRSYGDVQRL